MAIQKGTEVKYTSKFLRSIGALTGNMGRVRGVIVEIKKLGDSEIATIDWYGEGAYDIPRKVNIKNLKEKNKPEYFD